jgi:hypothetical protein
MERRFRELLDCRTDSENLRFGCEYCAVGGYDVIRLGIGCGEMFRHVQSGKKCRYHAITVSRLYRPQPCDG